MMMVVVSAMVMVPTVMAVMPPMHFRCRRSGIFLNRRGGAGITERHRIGALGWRCEREQRADSGESQNFRELHECSPWVGYHVCAESHRRNAARNLRFAT